MTDSTGGQPPGPSERFWPFSDGQDDLQRGEALEEAGPPRSGGGRAKTIIVILVWGILVPAAGIAMIVLAVQQHGDAARTSYTQAHGVRRAARVISEVTSADKDPTSALVVRLSGPVNGHDTTKVHIQGAPAYSPGAPVTVVVDPQDPGWAELPGAPYTRSDQWVLDLGIGLGDMLVFPFIIGITVLFRWRSRRRVRSFLLR